MGRKKRSRRSKRKIDQKPFAPKVRTGQHVYRKRNEILRSMGYSSYGEYLASPLWKTIRTRILYRDRFTCYCCGERATQVHHKRYTKGSLSGENENQLEAICRDCHHLCEYTGTTKNTTRSATDKMRLLRYADVESKKG